MSEAAGPSARLRRSTHRTGVIRPGVGGGYGVVVSERPPLSYADLAAMGVDRLNGVGDKRRDALAELGVHNVADLLTYYPRRYLDQTEEAAIDELVEGQKASVLVEVRRTSSRRVRGNRSMVTSVVTDGRSSLTLTFFNQAWRERQLTPGRRAVVYGKLEYFRGNRQMTSPSVDLVGGDEDVVGRVVPVYAQSDKAGIHTWDMTRFVDEALRRAATAPGARGLADPLPQSIRKRLDLADRQWAVVGIHQPEDLGQVSRSRRRLAFDELFRMQLALVLRKRALEATDRGVDHVVGGPLQRSLIDNLPFPLTGAQRRAIGEIDADLVRGVPMHRLLQGDVGAGKTLVAVSSMLAAVDGGHQAAMMAPTEVLAEQHHAGIRRLLEGLTVRREGTSLFGERPLSVELLTNRTSTADRKRILSGMLIGEVDIVIGTHSLIQDSVRFSSLGVVIVDEQHRFGVEQRAALRSPNDDGTIPDVLVMTATPIPRTAAMTVYGDLDVSVLDELPPGRTPIVTRWVKASGLLEDDDSEGNQPEGLEEMWASVRAEVEAGRQAYVVCPLIEESDKTAAASAEAIHDRLAGFELAGLRLGLLHGRLKPEAKDATMEQFRLGELDVIVATTVIEVGVDVPNATVMVILDADRFGIAQLHQLRGRVGRGAHASSCWLVGEGTTDDGEARMEALVATTDGFELAEVDLDLRGEGTILGERQKGRNDLKLASLRRDRELVRLAREAAIDVVDSDPGLRSSPELAAELSVFLDDEEQEFLLKG